MDIVRIVVLVKGTCQDNLRDSIHGWKSIIYIMYRIHVNISPYRTAGLAEVTVSNNIRKKNEKMAFDAIATLFLFWHHRGRADKSKLISFQMNNDEKITRFTIANNIL